jgi:hypothetical protein
MKRPGLDDAPRLRAHTPTLQRPNPRRRDPLPWRNALLGAPGGLAARLCPPPLAPGQTFAAAYDVLLLVDQREQLARGGMSRTGEGRGR